MIKKFNCVNVNVLAEDEIDVVIGVTMDREIENIDYPNVFVYVQENKITGIELYDEGLNVDCGLTEKEEQQIFNYVMENKQELNLNI
jgi:hypothetical protein